jgi:hypothetical protein
MLTLSVLVFALLLERIGLVLSIYIAVAVARAAAPDYRPVQVLILGTILAVGSVLLFVHGLGLPLRPWPEFDG